jgi:hypothetical protein
MWHAVITAKTVRKEGCVKTLTVGLLAVASVAVADLLPAIADLGLKRAE